MFYKGHLYKGLTPLETVYIGCPKQALVLVDLETMRL